MFMNVSPLTRAFQQVPDEIEYQIHTKLESKILCEKFRQIEGEYVLLSKNVHKLSRIFVLIF